MAGDQLVLDDGQVPTVDAISAPSARRHGGSESSTGRSVRSDPAQEGVVTDAVRFLRSLEGCTDSGDATAGGLSELRAEHPDDQFHLLTDVEAFDGSCHHDLIIRRSGSPTISLSVAPATGLPWPLRGVVSARERDLLEVDGTRLEVADAMASLDMMFDDRALMRTLIDGCLVKYSLAEQPVDTTPASLQAAADAFRRAKRLYARVDTETWLATRGLTAGDFATLITQQAQLEALRSRVVGDRVDGWFAAHADELATVVVGWMETAGDGRADADRLRADPVQAIIDATRRGRSAGVGQWVAGEHVVESMDGIGSGRSDDDARRVSLSRAGVREAFRATIGVPAVVVVLERRPARLDDATRVLVAHRLFDQWLADRRRSARITWFWGEERRTRS